MAGMRFKRECEYCSATFFTPDREAMVCPKCARRYKLPMPKTLERPSRAATTTNEVDFFNERQQPPKPKADKPTLQPHPRILTDELRAAIIKAYESYKDQPDMPMRLVHGKIAFDLKIKKGLVAQVVRELRGEPSPPAVVLTDAQKTSIIEAYRTYLESGERPPGGRRRTIASQLGIPYPAVAQVVNEWGQSHSNVDMLTRQQRFEVEKVYIRYLGEGMKPQEISVRVAEEQQLDFLRVLRWIDLLHDGVEELARVPDPTPEQVEAIETAYQEYLAGEAPPEAPLHQTFAEKFEVTQKQVHKVLVNYRYRCRGQSPN